MCSVYVKKQWTSHFNIETNTKNTFGICGVVFRHHPVFGCYWSHVIIRPRISFITTFSLEPVPSPQTHTNYEEI